MTRRSRCREDFRIKVMVAVLGVQSPCAWAACCGHGKPGVASQDFVGGSLGRDRADRSVASSVSMLWAITSLPIASTAASYITRARHTALKFADDLFLLNLISAHAMVPRCIIKSTHLLPIL